MRPALRPVEELAEALAAGDLTSAAIVEDGLAAIARTDDVLGAMLHVDASGARVAAAASDQRRGRGESLGPLDGIPVIVKDNIDVEGLPTTCASRMLEGYVPVRDATAVARLRAAGAVILGKANLDEFAMGSSNEHSAFGPARNPHDVDRVPGGSSGGSCVAVAAGYAPLALGSDTGGSVRLPASWCGVVGMKPTYGRVSRSGLVAFGSSLDQIGPVTRSARGTALALAALSGPDPADATTRPDDPDPAAALDEGVDGLRVGVARHLFREGCDDAVLDRTEKAVAALAAAGARVTDVEIPRARFGVAAYYVIASAEASSNLARFDGVRYGHRSADARTLEELYVGSRSEGFGDEVKRRILIGTYVLSAGYADRYYHRAQGVRDHLRRDFDRAFETVDVVVSPVAPTVAFPLGDRSEDPLAMYLLDLFTIPANLAGIPAVSVPIGRAGSMPVGLQIQAPAGADGTALRAAAGLERAIGPAAPPALATGENS